MKARAHLDIFALRSLVAAHQLGGFHRAAGHVGRSQSAISQQIQKLEREVGHPLFEKRGRGVALTETGELVLGYARRILELNDELVEAVIDRAVAGSVRLGLPADFSETWLPTALGHFRRAHPAIRIEAVVDRNRRLIERLDQGEIDLALALGHEQRADAEQVATLPMVWLGPETLEPVCAPGDALPLVVFESPCFFRQAAQDALDRAGRPWRIAFTSPSLPGIWAAVKAGLGYTLRTPMGLPAGVIQISERGELPSAPSPQQCLCLHDAGRPLSAALLRLRLIIESTLIENLAPQFRFGKKAGV